MKVAKESRAVRNWKIRAQIRGMEQEVNTTRTKNSILDIAYGMRKKGHYLPSFFTILLLL